CAATASAWASSSRAPRASAAPTRSAITAWPPTLRWKSSCFASSRGSCSHELPPAPRPAPGRPLRSPPSPVFPEGAAPSGHGAEPSPFLRAQREALGLVGRLGVGAEVMVIEAAVQPRVLAPFSRDRQLTLAAIRGAQPRDLPNRLGEAVRTARALVGQDSRAE